MKNKNKKKMNKMRKKKKIKKEGSNMGTSPG